MHFRQKISARHRVCLFDRFVTLVSPSGKTTLGRIHPAVVNVEELYRTHHRNHGMISTVPVLSNTTCTALPFYSGNYSPGTHPSNTVLQTLLFSSFRRHLYRTDAYWLSINLICHQPNYTQLHNYILGQPLSGSGRVAAADAGWPSCLPIFRKCSLFLSSRFGIVTKSVHTADLTV